MDDEQLAAFLLSNPIEYLTRRKFPDWRGVLIPQPISLSNTGRGGPNHEYRAKRMEEVKAYEAELKAKSADDLQTIYLQERSKEVRQHQSKVELEERQRFFNQPSSKADFEHWSKASYWTLDEAIALSFGKNPQVVTWISVKNFTQASTFAKRFAQTRDLAQRAKAISQLSDPVLPAVFLAWARRAEIEIPQELLEQVEKRGVVVADWKDAYDKLKEQYDLLLVDRDKIVSICQRLIQERDEFKSKVEALDAIAWEGFDPDCDVYPPELDIAMQAWRAVTKRPDANSTAKEQIESWLNQNYPDRRKLSQEARLRIAVICNWKKSGGRRRSEMK